MIHAQHQKRTDNHPHSERAKTPTGSVGPSCDASVGDLVYVYSDRNKSRARNWYMVTSIEGNWCNM